MKKEKYEIAIVLLSVLVMACSSDKNLFKEYELNQNQIRITKFIEIGPLKPFLAKDSADLLCKEYEITRSNKLAELNHSKEERIKAKNKALESLASSSNKQMVKIIENRLKFIESEIEYTNQLINTYKNHSERTFLNNFKIRIDSYKQNPDSILGYTQQVTFIGKEGLLPKREFTKTYFLSSTKQNILGRVQQ